MKEIFESHSVKTLKGEISKYNKLTKVSGYSKMTKKELVDLMLKHKDKFKHIKMNPKPLKALPKALTSKASKTSKEDKKEPKKEEPKKEEPKKEVKKPVKKIKKPVKKEAPKEQPKEKLIVYGREFERRPVINNTVKLSGLNFKNKQEEKEYKRVIEGGKPKTKEQAPPQLKKIYKDIEDEEKESKVPSIIKNWNKDVNNLELEQTNKRLTDTIRGLVNSKKKDINLDSILTFDLNLTKELMDRYKFQKVLDGYKRFVEYLDDEGEKNIGKDKLKDYYFVRDGRIMPNAMMKKLPQNLQKKILEEWKKQEETKPLNIASNFIKKSVDKLKKIKKGEFQKLRDAEREIRNESFKFNQIEFSKKDQDKLKEAIEKEKKRISPPVSKEELEKIAQGRRELRKRVSSRRKDGTFVFNTK